MGGPERTPGRNAEDGNAWPAGVEALRATRRCIRPTAVPSEATNLGTAARKDTTPDDALGHVVVSVPATGTWQGFFVLPGCAQRGDVMLREMH